MKTYIPVYQKRVDYDTNEVILDSNGNFIMDHVRDVIVNLPEPSLSAEDIAIIEAELFSLEQASKDTLGPQ
jgi:hypothetical protein